MIDVRAVERQRVSAVMEELCEGVMRCFALLKALKCLDDLGVREELVPLPGELSPDQESQEAVIYRSLVRYLRALGGLCLSRLGFLLNKEEAFSEWLERILQEEPWRHGYEVREALFNLLEREIWHHPPSLDATFHVIAECRGALECLPPELLLMRAGEEELLNRAMKTIERLATESKDLASDLAPVVTRWSEHEDTTISALAGQLAERVRP